MIVIIIIITIIDLILYYYYCCYHYYYIIFWKLVTHTVSSILMASWQKQCTLNVRSQGKQLVLFSLKSWCFPQLRLGKHQDSRENKTNWFPERPDIKCFVIFLDFHFNSNKRITGANQNSRLGTYNNTNLILQTTEWMIYKQKYFPHIICIFFLH